MQNLNYIFRFKMLFIYTEINLNKIVLRITTRIQLIQHYRFITSKQQQASYLVTK